MNGASYMGCYCDWRCRFDHKFNRDLPHHLGDWISPQKCIHRAKQQGYKYVGLQYGHECWAGNKAPQRMKRPERECNYNCSADKSKKCGAANRNSVWVVQNMPKKKPIVVHYVPPKPADPCKVKEKFDLHIFGYKCTKDSDCKGARTCFKNKYLSKIPWGKSLTKSFAKYGRCHGKSGCAAPKPWEKYLKKYLPSTPKPMHVVQKPAPKPVNDCSVVERWELSVYGFRCTKDAECKGKITCLKNLPKIQFLGKKIKIKFGRCYGSSGCKSSYPFKDEAEDFEEEFFE